VHHLQLQQGRRRDDAGGAEIGHDGGREADALEPGLDDSHLLFLTTYLNLDF